MKEAEAISNSDTQALYNGATEKQVHEWYNEQKLINLH